MKRTPREIQDIESVFKSVVLSSNIFLAALSYIKLCILPIFV